jgi:hypothetical protein
MLRVVGALATAWMRDQREDQRRKVGGVGQANKTGH